MKMSGEQCAAHSQTTGCYEMVGLKQIQSAPDVCPRFNPEFVAIGWCSGMKTKAGPRLASGMKPTSTQLFLSFFLQGWNSHPPTSPGGVPSEPDRNPETRGYPFGGRSWASGTRRVVWSQSKAAWAAGCRPFHSKGYLYSRYTRTLCVFGAFRNIDEFYHLFFSLSPSRSTRPPPCFGCFFLPPPPEILMNFLFRLRSDEDETQFSQYHIKNILTRFWSVPTLWKLFM